MIHKWPTFMSKSTWNHWEKYRSNADLCFPHRRHAQNQRSNPLTKAKESHRKCPSHGRKVEVPPLWLMEDELSKEYTSNWAVYYETFTRVNVPQNRKLISPPVVWKVIRKIRNNLKLKVYLVLLRNGDEHKRNVHEHSRTAQYDVIRFLLRQPISSISWSTSPAIKENIPEWRYAP